MQCKIVRAALKILLGIWPRFANPTVQTGYQSGSQTTSLHRVGGNKAGGGQTWGPARGVKTGRTWLPGNFAPGRGLKSSSKRHMVHLGFGRLFSQRAKVLSGLS